MTSRTVKTKRPIVHRPLISPSLTSLFSSFTQSSNGSSGSGSTVTQDSVTKRPRAQKKTSRRSHGHSRHLTRDGADQDIHAGTDRPNVFAFMEEEEEGEDGTQAPRSRKADGPKTMERRTRHGRQGIPPVAPESPVSTSSPFILEEIERFPPRASSIASLHSDSGISIRGPSPERSPIQGHKKSSSRSSTHKNHALTRTKSVSSTSSTSSRLSRMEQLETPESFYAKPQVSQSPLARSQTKNQQAQTKPRGRPPASPQKHGYDFLTSCISATDEEKIRPIYRRFETLNNRILMVMQDEIVTIEKDLAIVDRQIADLEGSTPPPASRRSELQTPTPMQWHRMQLVGMLIPKLSQYNRTLASYQSVVNMPTTSVDQIKQYKDLLEQYEPLVSSETAFLDETIDLVTVSTFSAIEHGQQKTRYELGATLFFLILAFKLIPSFIGRIILGGSVVGTLAWSGRLPMDEDAIAGVIGRRVGM